MAELQELIAREIAPQGIISFARFMALALYCPKLGYYEQAEPAIGRGGDFYTSVSVGSLFGELLAFQFAQWTEEQGLRPAQWVEAGAHDGRLAADILGWLRRQRPELYQQVEYWIVEPSARRQALQKAQLKAFEGRVRWLDDIQALPSRGINGLFFSNELLDAFPVHRLGWDAHRQAWFEWGVTFHEPVAAFVRKPHISGTLTSAATQVDSPFRWARLPPDPERWNAALRDAGLDMPPDLLAVLPDGFTLELCPEAAAWWNAAAQSLRAGKLLTLDYGFTAEELLRPERSQGTLRAYYRHRLSEDVLAHPGEQDLTAHVQFTHLQKAGELAGLHTEGLVSQGQWLTRIAERAWRPDSGFDPWTPAQTRQFRTLTFPEHLGRAFRVFIQTR